MYNNLHDMFEQNINDFLRWLFKSIGTIFVIVFVAVLKIRLLEKDLTRKQTIVALLLAIGCGIVGSLIVPTPPINPLTLEQPSEIWHNITISLSTLLGDKFCRYLISTPIRDIIHDVWDRRP
jgi:hypothetical protein